MYVQVKYISVCACVCVQIFICVCARVCVELVFATFLIRPPMPWGQAPRQSLPGITFPYIWRRRGNRHHLQGRLCLRPSWCSLRLPIPFSFQPSLSPLSSVFFSIFLFAVSLLLLLLSIAIALRAWTSAPPEGDASAVEMAERRAECGEIRLAFCRLDLATPVFEDVDLATAVRGFGFDNICCFFEDLVLVTPVSRFWFW